MTGSPHPVAARAGPVTRSERIVALDALRGFAVLGILVMNIQSFSMIGAAYFDPTAYGNLEGANYWVWLLSHLFIDQKFMTIFSMLFGAGIVLMTTRAESKGVRPAGVHYRRMLWLILFGLLHGYLLWYGDILFSYGVCGLIVYLFRNVSPRWLITIGFLWITLASAISVFFGLSMPYWPEDDRVEFSATWNPTPEKVEEELTVYRAGWVQQMELRVPATFFFQTFVFSIWGFWRAGGLMLIGMALFKLGVFSGQCSERAYRTMLAAGFLLGLPIVFLGVRRNFAADWDIMYSFFLGGQFNYWASLLVSMGWIGLVMLLLKRGALSSWARRLSAVGQMALTNYLLHTLICTTIFYGHGLGLFGGVERTSQIAIVFAIWIFQLGLSPIWLRHFSFGPFEWLWRSLTYGTKQPMRRVVADA